MRLGTSYGQIFQLSLPIMLGSAAQNIIVLSDNIFLYHYDHVQFAAVGIIGAFYLVLASIGYGFSRGGQIFIARKFGERDYKALGAYFQALVLFELLLAIFIFVLVYLFSHDFLKLFIASPEILQYCDDYLQIRNYGVFFSYTGVALIALYTGIANPKIILFDTLILTIANIVLNYIFVFGKLGLEPMGIKGSALASTLSEAIAFIVFVAYIIVQKAHREYHLLDFDTINYHRIYECFSISFPIVIQSALGLGSYFLFFTFIENNSAKDLEISNLVRNVYLILSIPTWGYSAGINTMVSNFIGTKKRQAVFPLIRKTANLSFLTTLMITLPILLFPEFFLYPLFGSDENQLISESKEVLLMLFPILGIFSIGSVFINGLTGTGHTKTALWIQTTFTFVYIIYSLIVIKLLKLNLFYAWTSEIIYWAGILLFVVVYLKTNKWHEKKF
ncbi:MAG: MATE family efflux transporter [Saprospiraceae bacterium]|nr:MATE family efflux transporter [Saprospiraceae bacterium]